MHQSYIHIQNVQTKSTLDFLISSLGIELKRLGNVCTRAICTFKTSRPKKRLSKVRAIVTLSKCPGYFNPGRILYHVDDLMLRFVHFLISIRAPHFKFSILGQARVW